MADLPPEYSQTDNDAGTPAADDMIEPGKMRLAERFVHAAASSSSGALYELAYAVDSLREHTREVELSRLEHRVVRSSVGSDAGLGAEPSVATRRKLIFTLLHPPEVTAPPYPYMVESESRRGLGSLGMRRLANSLTRRRHFAVWRITKDPRSISGEWIEREKVFDVRQGRDRGSEYEWTLVRSGGVIARESDEDGLRVLEVLGPAQRMTVDALVAGWCLRLWHDIAEQNHQRRTLKDVKRIIQTLPPDVPRTGIL